MRIFGDHEPRTIEQLERCVDAAEGSEGVLCADGHVGYSQPIGGVVAYREHLSPSGVGYDIGCGNKAVLTDVTLSDVQPDLPRIMDEVSTHISFGVGRNDGRAGDHPVIDEISDAAFAPQRQLSDLAAKQLGTVGAGNHYVDLFADERDRVWIGVHFGSRGFGHKTASGFLALAQGLPFDARASEGEMDSPPVLLHADSELGAGYAEAMTLAGRYAYAGRDVVCAEVCRILGAEALEEVHNHHNYAWRERHGERELWVVRKGATPAFPGQRGFVGGSMGDDAVILAGVESDTGAASFYSTVHGAGRVMSRTEARGRFVKDPETGKKLRQGGRVRHDEMQAWLRDKGVHLVGGDLDEAPQAYRRLPDVLAHHAGTVRIEHTLRPFAVVMAGADVFDPFKD